MPGSRRKNIIASRRRRQDDGEEDGSLVGDLEDDSLSEGSAASNVDGEDGAESDSSDDEPENTVPSKSSASTHPGHQIGQSSDLVSSSKPSSKSNGAFKAKPESRITGPNFGDDDQAQTMEEIHFNDLNTSTEDQVTQDQSTVPTTSPPHETSLQRSRREHQEYIQQRNANPAFVPTRGGFFLHDDRSGGSNGYNRALPRGRGRAYGPAVMAGRGVAPVEPADKQWAHDLHERHELAPKPEHAISRNQADTHNSQVEKHASTTTNAPNRTFSFTTILGNVTVQISLPGMDEKKLVPNVVRKHHTLLPQHRPPLRRDKPVRISIPNESPRYIFPSLERSFIFIPRALRPNNQYGRGRGRGSFHGSRRPSVYTPSVAMSRKSSIAASVMRDGVRSPAESIMSRMGMPHVDPTRPVVRMPSVGPNPSLSRLGPVPMLNGNFVIPPQLNNMYPAPPHEYHTALPIHQPRPQKAVSVAAIDSPTSFQVKAPTQQQEQPFHQQVPPHMATPSAEDRQLLPIGPGVAPAAPLSQIPEGAVFAPGFQPYQMVGAPPYYGATYQSTPAFYPPINESFGHGANGSALAPNFIPGSQAHHVGYLPGMGPIDNSSHVAHESNGMVYYFNNPPQMYPADIQGGYPVTGNNNTVMANGYPGQQQSFYYSPMPAGGFYPTQ